MNDHPAIIFAALMIFVYGLFSKVSDRSPVTAPMVFVALGILVGPLALDYFHMEVKGELVHILTEVTLILILFVDASTINLKQLIEDRAVPIRLLGIGLPLSMLLGTLMAWLIFPDLAIWMLVLMALILSPTDAALGQAVVKSEKVPERVRRWISVESGLNDGIALPPIFACIAALSATAGTSGEHHWLLFLLQQIFFGAVVGGLVGWVGGMLVEYCSSRDWMNSTFQRLVSGSLAILCFAIAEMIHGNGFIAAFAGDMNGILVRVIAMYGNLIRDIVNDDDRIKQKDHDKKHQYQCKIIQKHKSDSCYKTIFYPDSNNQLLLLYWLLSGTALTPCRKTLNNTVNTITDKICS